jgi:hypothetical protein
MSFGSGVLAHRFSASGHAESSVRLLVKSFCLHAGTITTTRRAPETLARLARESC